MEEECDPRLLGDARLQHAHGAPSAPGSLCLTPMASLSSAEPSVLLGTLEPLPGGQYSSKASLFPGDTVAVNGEKRLCHRRKSRKTELDELREHVKELEGQLATLRTHKDERDDSLVCPKLPAAEAASSPAALWERTARAQKDQRVRAEVENARLREVLEGQLKVAMSLEKLLRKRPSHEVGSCIAMISSSTVV